MTKGRDTERAAKALYEAAGYEVWQPPKAKYREQDVFGYFDLLCFGHGTMLGVQVKTNRADGVTEYFEQASVYEEHVLGFFVDFIVLFEDEGWKLYQTDETGYQVAFDGREIGETPAPMLTDVLRP